jgi:hypothetical protein
LAIVRKRSHSWRLMAGGCGGLTGLFSSCKVPLPLRYDYQGLKGMGLCAGARKRRFVVLRYLIIESKLL